MSKLFILGAGFSKAFSCHMPTLLDLGKYVVKNINKLPGNSTKHKIYRKIGSDPERLLTYLFQPMPWKFPDEVFVDRATFIVLSRIIAEYIVEKQKLAFHNSIPSWSERFINYLIGKESVVATLNYDTILETLYRNKFVDPSALGRGYDVQQITILDLYPLPIVNLLERKLHPTISYENENTFKFLKLHGSINWYYSGDENMPGQQVYAEDYATVHKYRDLVKTLKMDMIPLIIPPVTEKTSFYDTKMIKVAWKILKEAIRSADEIYCIGCSLPKTDLTVRLFLSTATDNYSGKKVYIVNNTMGKEKKSLIDDYAEVFGKRNLNKDYLGQINCVELMVNNL